MAQIIAYKHARSAEMAGRRSDIFRCQIICQNSSASHATATGSLQTTRSNMCKQQLHAFRTQCCRPKFPSKEKCRARCHELLLSLRVQIVPVCVASHVAQVKPVLRYNL